MVVTANNPMSNAMSVDANGPTITAKIELRFTGTFNPVYIYQNAHTLGLPDYGDYFAGTGAQLYCSHTDLQLNANSVWTGTTAQPGSAVYTCVFTTITAERMDLSPLSRPAQVCGGGIELTEVRRVDINGEPMTNAVGDYYEGLPEFYVPGSEFTVSWNVFGNPLGLCQTYSFSTNENAIWGQEAFSGVIGKITTQNVYEVYQGVLVSYWRITVPIRFRNDGRGWNFAPLNYGYRYKNDDGDIVNYVDKNTGVYGPVFLDSDGKLLNGDGTGDGAEVYPSGGGGTPDGYQTLTSTNWSGLGFPINPFA